MLHLISLPMLDICCTNTHAINTERGQEQKKWVDTESSLGWALPENKMQGDRGSSLPVGLLIGYGAPLHLGHRCTPIDPLCAGVWRHRVGGPVSDLQCRKQSKEGFTLITNNVRGGITLTT